LNYLLIHVHETTPLRGFLKLPPCSTVGEAEKTTYWRASNTKIFWNILAWTESSSKRFA